MEGKRQEAKGKRQKEEEGQAENLPHKGCPTFTITAGTVQAVRAVQAALRELGLEPGVAEKIIREFELWQP